jgi:hypothetical protein
MEKAEPHDTERREDKHGIDDLKEIGQQGVRLVEYPEGTGSTGHYYGTVNQKNTPIRQ